MCIRDSGGPARSESSKGLLCGVGACGLWGLQPLYFTALLPTGPVEIVASGRTIETSLGYFINPLICVLLGVLVLKERLRILQWAAMALGAIAVVVLNVAYGRLPWIALALSFAFYGFVKKSVGQRVDAITSLRVTVQGVSACCRDLE